MTLMYESAEQKSAADLNSLSLSLVLFVGDIKEQTLLSRMHEGVVDT